MKVLFQEFDQYQTVVPTPHIFVVEDQKLTVDLCGKLMAKWANMDEDDTFDDVLPNKIMVRDNVIVIWGEETSYVFTNLDPVLT